MKYKINFRHPVIQVGNWGFPGFLNEHLLDSINEIVSNGYAIIGGDSITVYPDAHIETCYVKGDDQYCLQFNYDDSDALENWDKFVLGSKENAIEEISYYISMISNEANKKYKYGMMVTYISESQARKGLKNVKNDNRSKNNKFIGDKINPYFDLVQKMILHERSKLDA